MCSLARAFHSVYNKLKPDEKSFAQRTREAYEPANESFTCTWMGTTHSAPRRQRRRRRHLQVICRRIHTMHTKIFYSTLYMLCYSECMRTILVWLRIVSAACGSAFAVAVARYQTPQRLQQKHDTYRQLTLDTKVHNTHVSTCCTLANVTI